MTAFLQNVFDSTDDSHKLLIFAHHKVGRQVDTGSGGRQLLTIALVVLPCQAVLDGLETFVNRLRLQYIRIGG